MKLVLLLFISLSSILVKAQKPVLATIDGKGSMLPKAPGAARIDIKLGDTVKLIKYTEASDLWEAQYKGTIGTIKNEMVKVNVDVTGLKNYYIVKDYKAAMIKKYGVKYGTIMATGVVALGMTTQMVKELYGEATSINRTVGSWGVHEQWVYERPAMKTEYYYFENGKLTSWQD